jgi:hypothetical protein
MPEKVKYIYVESARNDNRVALSEVDPAHPNGSVLVAGNTGPRKVAHTPFVAMRLREGEIREVSESKGKKSADAHIKAQQDSGAVVEPEPTPEANTEGAEPSEEELAAAGLTRDEWMKQQEEDAK